MEFGQGGKVRLRNGWKLAINHCTFVMRLLAWLRAAPTCIRTPALTAGSVRVDSYDMHIAPTDRLTD